MDSVVALKRILLWPKLALIAARTPPASPKASGATLPITACPVRAAATDTLLHGYANTTAGVGVKFAVSNGFGGLAADAGGAGATRGGRPRGQAAGPRPGAKANGALPAR